MPYSIEYNSCKSVAVEMKFKGGVHEVVMPYPLSVAIAFAFLLMVFSEVEEFDTCRIDDDAEARGPLTIRCCSR